MSFPKLLPAVVCVDGLFSQFSLGEANGLTQPWYAIIIIAGVLFRHRMAKACDNKNKNNRFTALTSLTGPKGLVAISLYLYEHRRRGPVIDVQR